MLQDGGSEFKMHKGCGEAVGEVVGRHRGGWRGDELRGYRRLRSTPVPLATLTVLAPAGYPPALGRLADGPATVPPKIAPLVAGRIGLLAGARMPPL